MRPGSLVRRLIWLAAGWIVAALLVTGVALSAFFQQSSLRQFDRALNEVVTALYAGANVEPGGEVLAPLLRDARNQRAYSGRYWQISEFGSDGRLAPAGHRRAHGQPGPDAVLVLAQTPRPHVPVQAAVELRERHREIWHARQGRACRH